MGTALHRLHAKDRAPASIDAAAHAGNHSGSQQTLEEHMMQIADPRWGEFARLQRNLNDRYIVDSASDSLEAALNVLVVNALPLEPGDTPVLLAQRAQNTALRRQRRRRGIIAREERLLLDLSRADADRPADAALHARIEIARIFKICTEAERGVVYSLADGGETAASLGVAPAAFRKRLQRLRDRIAA